MLSHFSHVQPFCTSVDCSLPNSSVHGILQLRILEWVAISSSKRLHSFSKILFSFMVYHRILNIILCAIQ